VRAGVRLLQIQQQSFRAGRLVTVYVDRILQGTQSVDLPVEEPMQFELTFNLKAAKELGLTMPPHVLARVDRVIKEAIGIRNRLGREDDACTAR
jgi:ABC-type uncharacterized transport system substrate-binding protein